MKLNHAVQEKVAHADLARKCGGMAFVAKIIVFFASVRWGL